jgi:hypothetical protein
MAGRKQETPAAVEVDEQKSAVDQGDAPVLPPGINEVWVPAHDNDVRFFPRLVAAADITFSSARYHINEQRDRIYTLEFDEGPVPIDWDSGEVLPMTVGDLSQEREPGVGYADCPTVAANVKNYVKWSREFKRWVRQAELVTLYRSKKYRLTSEAGETEGEFRVRLQQLANEKRDVAVAKLRKRYASKATTLESRLMRAQQAIEREQQQSSKKKLDTAVSFGTAILGAVLGRKRLSSSTASKMGTAIRSASGASKEAADVKRAKQTAEKVRKDLAALNKALEKEVAELDDTYDAQDEELKEIEIKPKLTDIHIPLVGLVWMPYRDSGDGRLVPAWK